MTSCCCRSRCRFAIAVLARRTAWQASLSEARFRALASQWPDTATGLLDRDLRFTLFAGDAFAPYWDPDEVTGKLLAEMMPPERFEEARPHVEAAFAGNAGPWTGSACVRT